MRRIGIVSDLHGTFDAPLYEFLSDVDEIWCAGDIGSGDLCWEISGFKPLRAVFGNMDGFDVRSEYGEYLSFRCEDRRVLMTHIGFQGGRYVSRAAELIDRFRPDIFISGHSHILKVYTDSRTGILNINPGACGFNGIHHVRTALRMVVDGSALRDMEVGEWSRKRAPFVTDAPK